jgi:TetR/AcrR family transcriptional repressor of mexJK operon
MDVALEIDKPESLGAKAQEVLAAASALFRAKGYEATSMDAVAKMAGVSKATVYAHFRSKDELFAAIVAQIAGQLAREIRVVMEAGLPLDQALTGIGERFLAMLVNPDRIRMFRMMAAQVDRFPELGRVFYRSGPMVMHDCLAGFLARAADDGLLEMPDPGLAAWQFLSLVKGHLHLRCLFDVGSLVTPAARRRHVAAAVELFLKGYGFRRNSAG